MILPKHFVLGACIGVCALLMETSAQAQTVKYTSVALAQSDFMSKLDGEHPGGWDFDIIQLIRPQKSCHRSSQQGGLNTFDGFGFGFNDALSAPNGMNVNMGRSFHFTVLDLLSAETRKCKWGGRFSVGFGVDLRNYRMTGHTRFEELPDKQVVLSDYPEGSIPNSSKMHIFCTTFNLKYIQTFARDFTFALGPELYIVRRPGNRHDIRNRYTLCDENQTNEVKERFKGIRTNKVGVNLVATLNYRHAFGFYVKYSPTNVLDCNYGPSFETLSTGILIMGK